jgi:methyl-accepting chemotaxis protein
LKKIRVNFNVQLSSEVAESLNNYVDQINKVEKELIVINQRFTEQKGNLKEFTSAIKSVEGTIQKKVSAAEETSSLVKQMTTQAFRVRDATTEIQDVLGLIHS